MRGATVPVQGCDRERVLHARIGGPEGVVLAPVHRACRDVRRLQLRPADRAVDEQAVDRVDRVLGLEAAHFRRVVDGIGATRALHAGIRRQHSAAGGRSRRSAGQRHQCAVSGQRIAVSVEQRFGSRDRRRASLEVGVEGSEVQSQPALEQVELAAELVGDVFVAVELVDLRLLQRSGVEARQGVARSRRRIDQRLVGRLIADARLPVDVGSATA